MQAALIVRTRSGDGRLIPLPETIFLIGRDPQCHLRPHCELVSQLHCAIAGWAGMVRVRDLRSRNGTFVNGRRVWGEQVVGDGDQLRIGSLAFTFRIRTADGLPIPVPPDRQAVQWLLDAAPDEAVLSSARRTRVRLSADEPETAAEEVPDRDRLVSAGRYLRDYFDHRRS